MANTTKSNVHILLPGPPPTGAAAANRDYVDDSIAAAIGSGTAAETPQSILDKLVQVDGTASGLDSDLLDGQHGAYYLNAANLTGTLPAGRSWALTGDVTSPAGSATTTLAPGVVSLSKMAALAPNSFIGNNSGSSATPVALTVAQAKSLLSLSKADVGLGNVDNTSDADKPVSNAMLTLLGGYVTTDSVQTITGDKTQTGNMTFVGQPGTGKFYLEVTGDGTTDINGITFRRKTISGPNNAVRAGDRILGILGSGWDGATYASSAAVDAFAEEAFTGTNAGASIRFATTGLGSRVRTQRWKIDAPGHLLPFANATYDIGNASFRVSTGYFTAIDTTSLSIGGNTAWHAGNDGSGSGLDADLLDGQHAAYYLSAANLTGTISAARSWAMTGDVTSTAGSSATTIAMGAVTLPKMAALAANTLIGNNGGTATTPSALTPAQVRTMLNVADGATANTGTVTSVGLSVPTGFSVTNSPVTTTGSLAFAYAAGYQGYTGTEATKLSGIAAGATVGATWGTNLNGIPALISAFTGLANAPGVLTNNGTGTLSWGTVGSVTSVGLSLPAMFSVTNSPVTGSGTLTATLTSQTAKTFFAAPVGAAGAPSFRAIDPSDVPTLNQNTTGSAATLTTARTINGTSFNGSANITTNSWGTSRTVTIGSTGKAVDGSGNVSWTLAEIGAQAALGYTAENVANKGVANGYAGLGADGKVPSAQLPSYVDDVVEAANFAGLPATGESGKIYVTIDDGKIFRWSGSLYINIGASASTADTAVQLATARTFTIGSTGKTFDGSANVSWSLTEIGAPSLAGVGATGTWGISISGSAATLTTARTIALSGGATGTATSFNGSANISIPVTALDATKLTGTIDVARSWALTGDVTSPAGSSATTIAAGAVTLSKMAALAANSFIGNNTGSAATPIAMTAAQAKTLLSLSKADVGLGNVDNTSDLNKPISTATQTALNGKQATLGYTPINKGGDTGVGTLTYNNGITMLQAVGGGSVKAGAAGYTIVVSPGAAEATVPNVAAFAVRGYDDANRLVIPDSLTRPVAIYNTSLTVGGNTVWNTGNDGAGSGLDADLLDGQEGGYYLPRTVGSIAAEGFWKRAAAVFGSANNVTGTLVIKTSIPAASTTMCRFAIDGYDYSTNGSWRIECGGYFYNTTPKLLNHSAQIYGGAPSSEVYHAISPDGFKCLLIGIDSTVWKVPKISVDAMVGHSATAALTDGWVISVVADTSTYVDKLPFAKNQPISNITGLQAALDDKFSLSTPNVLTQTTTVSAQLRIENGSIFFTGTSFLDLNNKNIVGVNSLMFSDPGSDEGLGWTGGSGWRIWESPNDLGNGSGNLQIVTNADVTPTRHTTFNTDGSVDVVAGPLRVADKDVGLAVNSMYYVVGSGAANAWTGTVPGLTAYYEGLNLRFKLGFAGGSTTTLNLNGLGAKPVYLYGTTRLTTHYPVGSVVSLTYSNDGGGCFYAEMYYDTVGDVYLKLGSSVQAGELIHGYQLLVEGRNGKYYPVTRGGVNATTNTVSDAEFKVGGSMLYYESATDVAANAAIAAASLFQAYTSSTWEYWTNRSTTAWATAYLPVYLVGSINANGNFVLDNTTNTSFLTQTLPTTEDGKVYWQIGYMANTTDSGRLDLCHPMYEYKGGKLRLYVPDGVGGGSGSGMTWQTVTSANVATAVTDTGYLMVTGGTLRTITLPASVPMGFYLVVHAMGGQVVIVSNGNVIAGVGAGNDLQIEGGNTVTLVANAVGALEILSATGGSAAIAIADVTGLQAALDAKLDATATATAATKLATARAINGTNFDGTAAITTANWGTARTLTIGDTGKSVNGSADVSWSLAEIGAAAASHQHVIGDVTGLQGALDAKAPWDPALQSTTTTATLNVNSNLIQRAVLTAQAAALSIANPTGTPADGRKLMYVVKDNGTARAITFDTQFRGVGPNVLPTTTKANKRLRMGFEWCAADSKWDLIALLEET